MKEVNRRPTNRWPDNRIQHQRQAVPPSEYLARSIKSIPWSLLSASRRQGILHFRSSSSNCSFFSLSAWTNALVSRSTSVLVFFPHLAGTLWMNNSSISAAAWLLFSGILMLATHPLVSGSQIQHAIMNGADVAARMNAEPSLRASKGGRNREAKRRSTRPLHRSLTWWRFAIPNLTHSLTKCHTC